MPNTCAAIVIAAKHSELIKVKDASGVTNTIGALRCKFEFRTADWDKSARTAVFCKGNMATHPNIIETAISVPLDSVDECAVPWEVLVPDAKYFSVGLWGITETGLRVVSKWLVFRVVDGCYVDSAEPADPTPTVYEQIMLALNSKAPVDHNHDDIYYTKEEIDSAKILAEDVLYSYDSDLDITNTKEALDGIIGEVFNLMTSDGEVKEELKNKESISNKTTEIAETSTDNQYPTAKAVYDYGQSLSVDVVTEFDIETPYEDDQVYSANAINSVINILGEELGEISKKENLSNKITKITDTSTDIQYPSAKAVYDYINQYDHITKLRGGDSYIFHLPAGIYSFPDASYHELHIGNDIGDRPYFCDNGSFLFVGGEHYSGNLPKPSESHYFKKSVILLRSVDDIIAEVITGIANITYTINNNGEVSYKVIWNGGPLETQNDKVNTINENATDTQYPSAKAVYEYGQSLQMSGGEDYKEVTDEDIMDTMAEMGLVVPIISDGAILISNNNEIYSL